MAKYIEREAAYELARTSDYYSDFHKSIADLSSLKELLEDAPAADVVEVVRCKNCRFSDIDGMRVFCENPNSPWYNNEFSVYMAPDASDFCSYGKRRVEE